MFKNGLKRMFLAFILISGLSMTIDGIVEATNYPDSQWAPDWGVTYVGETYDQQRGFDITYIDSFFSWNSSADMKYLRDSETDTFELDTIFYAEPYPFAYEALGGGRGMSWDTDMNGGYLDSQLSDDPDTPTFGIGTASPDTLVPDKVYFASIYADRGGNSSPMSITAQRGRCVGGVCDPSSTIFAWESSILLSKNAGVRAPGEANY